MGKIKPNEKCPCGSSKKYKKCCGLAGAATSGATAAPGHRVPVLTAQMVDLIEAGDVHAVKRLIQGGLDVNT